MVQLVWTIALTSAANEPLTSSFHLRHERRPTRADGTRSGSSSHASLVRQAGTEHSSIITTDTGGGRDSVRRKITIDSGGERTLPFRLNPPRHRKPDNWKLFSKVASLRGDGHQPHVAACPGQR